MAIYKRQSSIFLCSLVLFGLLALLRHAIITRFMVLMGHFIMYAVSQINMVVIRFKVYWYTLRGSYSEFSYEQDVTFNIRSNSRRACSLRKAFRKSLFCLALWHMAKKYDCAQMRLKTFSCCHQCHQILLEISVI